MSRAGDGGQNANDNHCGAKQEALHNYHLSQHLSTTQRNLPQLIPIKHCTEGKRKREKCTQNTIYITTKNANNQQKKKTLRPGM